MAEQPEEQSELMVISSDTAAAHSSSDSTSARFTSTKKRSFSVVLFQRVSNTFSGQGGNM